VGNVVGNGTTEVATTGVEKLAPPSVRLGDFDLVIGQVIPCNVQGSVGSHVREASLIVRTIAEMIGNENVSPPLLDSENKIVPPPLFTNCVQLMYTRPLKVLFVIVSTARYGLSLKTLLRSSVANLERQLSRPNLSHYPLTWLRRRTHQLRHLRKYVRRQFRHSTSFQFDQKQVKGHCQSCSLIALQSIPPGYPGIKCSSSWSHYSY